MTGAISANLVRKLKDARSAKVINLGSVVASRAWADDLQKQVATAEELADLHPVHAAYVFAQNQVSVMSEQLSELKEMAPIVDILSKAEDLYSPSGPPMSPLTTSYFTSWAFFDACVGPTRETIGTITLAIGAAFGMQAELLRVIQSMQESWMGLYLQRGTDGSLVVLEDIVTGTVCRAISPTGYHGRKGELWYVRVMPPLADQSEHVIFTTPYIVLDPPPRDWMAYFARTFEQRPNALVEDGWLHMKYGPTRQYWNDFVFEAYVNHRKDVIYLTGLPDVPESRPHSKVNGWGFRG